jgi:hypothetical protein
MLLVMEPLSALSLATCVVQFIDFGPRLVRKTNEIVEIGSAIFANHLSDITSDLLRISIALAQQFELRSIPAGIRGKEDRVSTLLPSNLAHSC